jgi:hypothetical protein
MNDKALWKGDVLRRAELAKRITSLVQTHKSGAVIGIEGDFGSGKTYFLTNLREQFRSGDRACVYFNAWESDFAENPLLALLADIVSSLHERVPKAGATEKMKDAAKRLWPVLARIGLKSVLRAGSEEVDRLLGPMDEEVDRMFSTGSTAGKFGRTELVKARLALAELIDVAQAESPDSFPLIVLVDELDRANPRWAVTFLESVKHILGQQHIVFLVAVDRPNFVALLKHEFGADYGVDEYLSKFFNYSVRIQDATADRDFLLDRLRSEGLVSDGILKEEDNLNHGLHAVATCCLFGLGGPSGRLRRLERCAERLSACLRSSGGGSWAALVGFLVGIETSNRPLFEAYAGGLRSEISLRAFADLRRDEHEDWISIWLLACTMVRDEWTTRRSHVQAALGAKTADEVQRLLIDHFFVSVGSYHSATDIVLERIGWLLSRRPNSADDLTRSRRAEA